MTSDTFSIDLNRHVTKKLFQFGDLEGWIPGWLRRTLAWCSVLSHSPTARRRIIHLRFGEQSGKFHQKSNKRIVLHAIQVGNLN